VKYLKEMSFFKNEEKEKGNLIVSRILEIIESDKISIKSNGGYEIELDDKIYVFSKFGRSGYMSIYNLSQRHNVAGVCYGEPISSCRFSKKLWKQLVNIFIKQQDSKLNNEFDKLADVNRTSKKYGL